MTEKQFWCLEGYEGETSPIVDGKFAPTNGWLCNKLNELAEENHKIKSILLKKVEELNDDYNKSAKAGMPTGGIIGELDSFEEICKIMGWIE